ncbi:family 10 glycosylhydrolase, partial [Acinetobacter baumannii]
KEFGKNPPLNTKDSLWVEWRTNLLTSFQKDLYTSIKKIKPHILVTTAPNIYPWAKEEYLQDWPKWINNECTDLVFVQLYRYQ